MENLGQAPQVPDAWVVTDRDAIVEKGDVGSLLQPPNFAAQMICDSDEAAIERVYKAILEIAAGDLSPDTDYSFMWVERFGASNKRKPFEKTEEQDEENY